MRKTFDALTEISTRIAKSYPVAEAGQRKTMIRESVADATGTAYAAHERLTGSNLLTWSEAEYEGEYTGTLGTSFSSSGNSATIVSVNQKKWLEHHRSSSATGNYIIPFADWIDRTEGVPGDYIMSGEVMNPDWQTIPITVWLEAKLASDSSGTGSTTVVVGDPITLQPGASDRVFIRFTYDPSNPYMRFYHHLGQQGASSMWIRQMLEAAGDTQTLPGTYRNPSMNSNAITAPLVHSDAIGDPEIQNTVVDNRQAKNSVKNGVSSLTCLRSTDGSTGSAQPFCATPFMHYPKPDRMARLEQRENIKEAPPVAPEFTEANFRALVKKVEDLSAFTIELSHLLMDYRHMSGPEREEWLEGNSREAIEYKARVLSHEYPKLVEQHEIRCRLKDHAERLLAGIPIEEA